MYLFENPVLQRELLVNLRMRRAFVLQMVYVLILGAVVYAAWPEAKKIDMTNPEAARTLVNLFFLGQYLLASLMAPSFAAGAIAGEKERKSYEMLLASPLRPSAIVLGKLLASLSHLAILIFSSLPIVMLCLPLGGVSLYEVLAAYFALILSVVTFGMISLACSSYFQRTASSLVVSYLLVLPLALLGLLFWRMFEGGGAQARLVAIFTVLPVMCLGLTALLFSVTSNRLLHPPDVGSEGKEVVDESLEQRAAVGLIIQRDQFPDRLFAPAKRTDLLEDGQNPVYDKEMRSEMFSQGTLMLRVVIMVSMLLAIPMMAFCLFVFPSWAPWYISYVVLFNMLVGPVFAAGSVTSERERETLDLLLVTTLSPWQILWGKLLSGLRVSSVLTSLLLWPLLLSCVITSAFWSDWRIMLAYLAIIALVCLTTSLVALICSVLFRKTSVSMITAYMIIVVAFTAPVAARIFAETFYEGRMEWVAGATFTSPFATAFGLPINSVSEGTRPPPPNWPLWYSHIGFYLTFDTVLAAGMVWLFNTRWRVAS